MTKSFAACPWRLKGFYHQEAPNRGRARHCYRLLLLRKCEEVDFQELPGSLDITTESWHALLLYEGGRDDGVFHVRCPSTDKWN